jgi:endonuclease YncB( thermonuclease family)
MTILLGLLVGAAITAVAVYLPIPGWVSTQVAHVKSPDKFGLCFTGGGINCVVDGDTFWNEGVDIRVADIDAPETHPPQCSSEADLGKRATLRLQELLNEGPFTLQSIDRDEDQYRRKLRIVMRDGRSLGRRLVEEGLARPWSGSRQPWC